MSVNFDTVALVRFPLIPSITSRELADQIGMEHKSVMRNTSRRPFVILPSQEDLNDLLEYRDGNLYWRKASRKGKSAEHSTLRGSYKIIYLRGQRLAAHRVIFKMFYGEEPDMVDHIDRNPLNNKIHNLRSATASLNAVNSKTFCSNTSGYRNIFVSRNCLGEAVYVVTLKRGSKSMHLGRFKILQEAIEARDSALLQIEIDNLDL